ncbi:MAG: DUF4358 domain-containing protein [Lachnospiraceae bacterium]|nr:DUF4358 domain-containing protein [Lachnospiraceae bacterium]
MKKKSIAMLCAALLAVSLAACGGNPGESRTDQEQSSVQDSSEESSPESAPTEPGDDQTQGGESQPAESEGAAGGYEEGWSQEMENLKKAVTDELGGEYWPDTQVLPDMLEMNFAITSDMYDDYLAEMPMISTNVDTLLIVKAKDDKVEAVQSAVEAYREARVNDSMQYPMNIGKVQASRIETIGNYVIFVQLGGDTQKVMDDGDEAVIAMCQEVNDRAIEAIRGQL